MNGNENVIYKLSKFAFICSVIGVILIGVLPPLGAAGIAVPLTLKKKNAQVPENAKLYNKYSLILGVVSLIMFVVDIVIALVIIKISK